SHHDLHVRLNPTGQPSSFGGPGKRARHALRPVVKELSPPWRFQSPASLPARGSSPCSASCPPLQDTTPPPRLQPPASTSRRPLAGRGRQSGRGEAGSAGHSPSRHSVLIPTGRHAPLSPKRERGDGLRMTSRRAALGCADSEPPQPPATQVHP